MISICVDMSKGNIFKRIRSKVALFQIEKLENSKKGGKPVDRSGLYQHSKKKNKAVLDEVSLFRC